MDEIEIEIEMDKPPPTQPTRTSSRATLSSRPSEQVGHEGFNTCRQSSTQHPELQGIAVPAELVNLSCKRMDPFCLSLGRAPKQGFATLRSSFRMSLLPEIVQKGQQQRRSCQKIALEEKVTKLQQTVESVSADLDTLRANESNKQLQEFDANDYLQLNYMRFQNECQKVADRNREIAELERKLEGFWTEHDRKIEEKRFSLQSLLDQEMRKNSDLTRANDGLLNDITVLVVKIAKLEAEAKVKIPFTSSDGPQGEAKCRDESHRHLQERLDAERQKNISEREARKECVSLTELLDECVSLKRSLAAEQQNIVGEREARIRYEKECASLTQLLDGERRKNIRESEARICHEDECHTVKALLAAEQQKVASEREDRIRYEKECASLKELLDGERQKSIREGDARIRHDQECLSLKELLGVEQQKVVTEREDRIGYEKKYILLTKQLGDEQQKNLCLSGDVFRLSEKVNEATTENTRLVVKIQTLERILREDRIRVERCIVENERLRGQLKMFIADSRQPPIDVAYNEDAWDGPRSNRLIVIERQTALRKQPNVHAEYEETRLQTFLGKHSGTEILCPKLDNATVALQSDIRNLGLDLDKAYLTEHIAKGLLRSWVRSGGTTNDHLLNASTSMLMNMSSRALKNRVESELDKDYTVLQSILEKHCYDCLDPLLLISTQDAHLVSSTRRQLGLRQSGIVDFMANVDSSAYLIMQLSKDATNPNGSENITSQYAVRIPKGIGPVEDQLFRLRTERRLFNMLAGEGFGLIVGTMEVHHLQSEYVTSPTGVEEVRPRERLALVIRVETDMYPLEKFIERLTKIGLSIDCFWVDEKYNVRLLGFGDYRPFQPSLPPQEGKFRDVQALGEILFRICDASSMSRIPPVLVAIIEACLYGHIGPDDGSPDAPLTVQNLLKWMLAVVKCVAWEDWDAKFGREVEGGERKRVFIEDGGEVEEGRHRQRLI
ncbi:hypothetical protein BC829DRAFT_420026 [Chytridium lagenaria]|nr:hypothetical protein BC829DRAFT_420026 [Chytridium lagenaria]